MFLANNSMITLVHVSACNQLSPAAGTPYHRSSKKELQLE